MTLLTVFFICLVVTSLVLQLLTEIITCFACYIVLDNTFIHHPKIQEPNQLISEK